MLLGLGKVGGMARRTQSGRISDEMQEGMN